MPDLDLHVINIFVHVSMASLAIIGGMILLITPKGTPRHRLVGRITLGLIGISLTAAIIGAVFFRAKLDLMFITVLTAYHMWSGPRALHLRHNGRGLYDVLAATVMVVLGLATIVTFKLYSDRFYWGGGRAYAMGGGLIFYGGWDLLRTTFPASWRVWLNPAEHGFKMTSLIGALVSVAVPTVMRDQSGYSTLVVSFVFMGLACVFSVRAAMRARRRALGVTPSAALNARLNTDSEL
jgi:hypothetical protein